MLFVAKDIAVQCKNLYVVRCAIWYHLYNLKNVKNTHGGVLILVKLKLTLLHGCFSRFLSCKNSAKSRNASHISKQELILPLQLGFCDQLLGIQPYYQHALNCYIPGGIVAKSTIFQTAGIPRQEYSWNFGKLLKEHM